MDRIAALDRLAEAHPDERASAFANALEASRDPAKEVRGASAGAIGATGSATEAVTALARLAGDADVGVRMAAAIALAESPWRGRLDVLRTLLDDEDPGVAGVAAEALAHAGDRSAIPRLRAMLGDRRLRFHALEGLLDVGDEELPNIVRRSFGSFFAPPFEKAAAAVALARTGDAAALEHLRARMQKRRAEERPFILVHLAQLDPGEGRRIVETIARTEGEYLRESALLALARLDASTWWAPAQECIGRFADADPYVAAEVLLTLFEIDWKRASLVADAHASRENELGAAARRVRLAAALRAAHPAEILVRCD